MLQILGRRTVSALTYLGEISILFAQTLSLALRPPWRGKNLLSEMVNVGLLSLPVVIITGAFTGMVLALQSYYVLHKMTLETVIGGLVNLSLAKELGPVLTALMLAGRVGAAITAQVGTMKVTEQIDALQSLAVNPVKYLVVPRFLACLILLPILTIYTVFIGMLGGYIASVKMMGINATFYLSIALERVAPHDILNGLIKALFFGMIIGIIACHKGLTARGGAEGVGRATTGSVVTSCILILIANFFITIALEIVNL
ncbi:ABC transporter permease [candidate division NPL-UPA2 bacterium]|nr:ABC transporter permease [candidate division NPL-UPA2 bacterium]